jgi:hypothetical protein
MQDRVEPVCDSTKKMNPNGEEALNSNKFTSGEGVCTHSIHEREDDYKVICQDMPKAA